MSAEDTNPDDTNADEVDAGHAPAPSFFIVGIGASTPPRLAAPHGPHLPVDYFLRSLAADQGSRSIGIVLSGTGTDGTFGLRAIKETSGITFAQDPASAKYDQRCAHSLDGRGRRGKIWAGAGVKGKAKGKAGEG